MGNFLNRCTWVIAFGLLNQLLRHKKVCCKLIGLSFVKTLQRRSLVNRFVRRSICRRVRYTISYQGTMVHVMTKFVRNSEALPRWRFVLVRDYVIASVRRALDLAGYAFRQIVK